MSFQKNTSGQKWLVFAFDRTTNAPKTGDAANITAKIRKDYASAVATNDVNPDELEDGYYEFTLTQAESNATVVDLFPESATANIQVIGVPGRSFIVPTNFPTLGIASDGDLTKVNTLDGHTAQTGDTFALANGATGFAAIDTVVDAILVDTNDLQTNQGNWLTATGFATPANVATELATYDGPTNAEMVAAFTEIKGATWATTDTLEAIRDRGDVAWLTATGFATTNPDNAGIAAIKVITDQFVFTVANQVDANALGGLDAAGVRSAIGLSTANLDTQLGDLPTNAELATALGTADDATLAAIAALNDFDPAVDVVAHVTLVDTTTTNTDMRGTDGANTTPPPSAATISTQVASDLAAAHGAGSWATATGFSTLTTTDIDNRLAAYDSPTNAEMEARTIAAANYATLANQATIAGYLDTEIAAIKAKTDNLPASPASTGDIPTVSQIWTTALTEAYRSAGATGTASQLLYEILQNITEFAIAGTTKTVKKLDGSTTAKTYTLNSSTSPTSITEAT